MCMLVVLGWTMTKDMKVYPEHQNVGLTVAGFAKKYDKDKANECKDKGDDNYNSSWGYACRDAGYMPDECDDFKYNPSNL